MTNKAAPFYGSNIAFLEKLNYVPPVIKPYDKNGVVVYKDTPTTDQDLFYISGNIMDADSPWVLTVDGKRMMAYHPNHGQVFHFYSHYKLALGHVICTGLGFGAREQWLATKPEVKKITVLEKYKSVIDYHKDIGTQWSDKIEIINCDANEYKGNCDFLSIDHYEKDSPTSIIDSIKNIEKNIGCCFMWFWLLERWLDNGYIDNNKKDIIHYQPWEKNNLIQSYNKLKISLGLKSLPKLSRQRLTEFVDVYWNRI